MTYELARQLEVAGFQFSQKRILLGQYKKLWKYLHTKKTTMATDSQLVPTLSELIEACGDKLSHIKRIENENPDGRWWAVSRSAFNDGVNNIEECGPEPDAAVAKLWLALHPVLRND